MTDRNRLAKRIRIGPSLRKTASLGLPAVGDGSRRRLGPGPALGAMAASLALALPAYAQAPQPVAPTREEIERVRPAPLDDRQPRLRIEGDIERAPCALGSSEYDDIRFTPTDVQFEELRGLSAADLRPAYEPFLGAEHPVSVICEIRDRAAAMLRSAGYVASVEVPEQQIADGGIRFRVVMARLVGLRVRGDAGRAERHIAGYLDRLTEQEVFNRYEAERYLLLAGDLPGYNVRLALRSAGAGRGEVIGEVTIVRTAALADITIQNYGAQALGRWGVLARGQLFGLTGLGDRTMFAVFTTPDLEEQQTFQIAHDFRLGGEGLALGGQLTYARARPDLGDPHVDFDSRTLFASLEASYPFVRRQEHTLRGSLGLDLIDQKIAFNDLPFNRDRLRMAFVRFDYSAFGLAGDDRRFTIAEPAWRIDASAEIRRGLDIFDASDGCGSTPAACVAPGAVTMTRLEADPTATIFRARAYGEYRPVPKVTFALAARAQHSGSPLPAFEEHSAGNYTEGRGYDPGAILGDSGIGLRAELRFGTTVIRGRDNFAAEPFIFVDQAWAWNEERLLPIPRRELTSIGAGVRANLGNRLWLDVVLAAPLDRAGFPAVRPEPRLLVSLTSRLWPWRFR